MTSHRKRIRHAHTHTPQICFSSDDRAVWMHVPSAISLWSWRCLLWRAYMWIPKWPENVRFSSNLEQQTPILWELVCGGLVTRGFSFLPLETTTNSLPPIANVSRGVRHTNPIISTTQPLRLDKWSLLGCCWGTSYRQKTDYRYKTHRPVIHKTSH